MNLGVRTILLLVAVVLFVLGIFMDATNFDEMLFLGLAAFAGAFLSDALGYADRTFGTRTTPTSSRSGAKRPFRVCAMRIRSADPHLRASGGSAGAR